ncbi:hypothetical protein JL107_01780 [Nakamurella flavida]|uniref:Fibronectin type-III domain-containing protein n=1 Tax=Nakamurella flavida TaxID=363630 RepID=A0A938YLL9_9ACTN|nr:hypothetical protein [Nakamurella flavida]MBM9475165.1 hypothetical protein [Nakamurella flavida]MDP9776738.1 hypothetical protein [Nakamurella flavida]
MSNHRDRALRVPVAVVLCVLLMLCSVSASADWGTAGRGGGVAQTGTLAPPSALTVPRLTNMASLPVRWAPPARGPVPTGYFVERVGGGTTQPVCNSGPARPLAALSCADTGLRTGAVSYRVTAVYRSWTATAVSDPVQVALPAAVVFCQQPTSTIAGTPVSPGVELCLVTATGDPAEVAGIPVTIGLTGGAGQGVLNGTLTRTTDAQGAVTFDDLSVNRAADDYHLQATASGLTPATSSTFAVIPADGYHLVMTTAAQSGPAATGATLGPITVQRQDWLGNPVVLGAAASVALTSSTTGTARFAATSGGTAVTTVSIPANSSTATFYYGDTRAGSPVVSATAAGLASGSQAQRITAAAASKLAVTSLAVTGTATAAPTLGPLTVQRQDAFGNAVPTTAAITITLSSSSTGTTGFSTTAGGATIGTVTMPAGTSTVSFTYGDTRAGSPVVTAATTGLTSATQTQTIRAGTATRLAVTSAARTGGASSAANLGAITVQQQDVFGNAVVATAAVPVVPASNSAGTTRFAARASGTALTSTTIAVGASSTTLYYGDTRAGTPVLTFTSPGLTAVSQGATIVPATARKLVFLTPVITAAPTAAPSLGPLTVQRQDTFGNAVVATTALTVTLSSSATTTGQFAATPGGAVTTTVTIAAGASTTSFGYGDTRAGTPKITAASSGLTSATQTETITATATRLVVTTAARTATASSRTNLGAVTVQRQDAFGNAVLAPTGGTPVTLTSSTAGVPVFSTTSGGTVLTTVTIPAGSSAVSFYYGDTRVGTPTLTAAAAGLASATQVQTITPGTAAKLTLITPPTTGPAADTATLGPLTVQRQDTFGNAVPAPTGGLLLTLASSSSGARFAGLDGAALTTLALPEGASTASFRYGDTRAGSPVVSVVLSGLTTATQIQVVTPAPASRLVITTAAPTGTASAVASTGPISVQAQDAFGNAAPAPDGGLGVQLGSSTTGTATFSTTAGGPATNLVTIPAGAATVTFYAGDTRSGTATLAVTAAGLTGTSQTVTTVPAAATRLVYLTAPVTGRAATTATLGPLTVQRQDPFGNPVGGGAITVALTSSTTGTARFATAAGGSAVTAVTIASGASTATFYTGDTRVGTATLTASATGLTAAAQPLTSTG